MSEENQKRSLKKSTLLWKRVTLAQKYLNALLNIRPQKDLDV